MREIPRMRDFFLNKNPTNYEKQKITINFCLKVTSVFNFSEVPKSIRLAGPQDYLQALGISRSSDLGPCCGHRICRGCWHEGRNGFSICDVRPWIFSA